MSQFLQGCNGNCQPDFMAIHYYNDASQIEDFKNHVTQAINLAAQYNMSEVCITEFGVTGSTSAQVEFIQEANTWLDSQHRVGCYAYFMDADGYLLSGESLSDLGSAYCS
jgi:hypothetical protein